MSFGTLVEAIKIKMVIYMEFRCKNEKTHIKNMLSTVVVRIGLERSF